MSIRDGSAPRLLDHLSVWVARFFFQPPHLAEQSLHVAASAVIASYRQPDLMVPDQLVQKDGAAYRRVDARNLDAAVVSAATRNRSSARCLEVATESKVVRSKQTTGRSVLAVPWSARADANASSLSLIAASRIHPLHLADPRRRLVLSHYRLPSMLEVSFFEPKPSPSSLTAVTVVTSRNGVDAPPTALPVHRGLWAPADIPVRRLAGAGLHASDPDCLWLPLLWSSSFRYRLAWSLMVGSRLDPDLVASAVRLHFERATMRGLGDLQSVRFWYGLCVCWAGRRRDTLK